MMSGVDPTEMKPSDVIAELSEQLRSARSELARYAELGYTDTDHAKHVMEAMNRYRKWSEDATFRGSREREEKHRLEHDVHALRRDLKHIAHLLGEKRYQEAEKAAKDALGASPTPATDPIEEFISARCVLSPTAEVEAAPLWREWEAWTEKNGVSRSRLRLSRRLQSMGCRMETRPMVLVWLGVGLKRDGEVPA
jgi:hypothetical protein